MVESISECEQSFELIGILVVRYFAGFDCHIELADGIDRNVSSGADCLRSIVCAVTLKSGPIGTSAYEQVRIDSI